MCRNVLCSLELEPRSTQTHWTHVTHWTHWTLKFGRTSSSTVTRIAALQALRRQARSVVCIALAPGQAESEVVVSRLFTDVWLMLLCGDVVRCCRATTWWTTTSAKHPSLTTCRPLCGPCFVELKCSSGTHHDSVLWTHPPTLQGEGECLCSKDPDVVPG